MTSPTTQKLPPAEPGHPRRRDSERSAPLVSVVIPAHDEESVIGRCLHSILDDAGEDEIEVVVVCNGCSDDTAGIARTFGPRVTVIETEVRSKTHALELGDRAVHGFPRFYTDADVVLPIEAIRRVREALVRGKALAAAPEMHVDLSGRIWPIQAFYRIWTRLPYSREGMVGSGVYALSERGRERFDGFDSLIADDAFVRLQFRPDERRTVRGCSFTVQPPHTVGALVRIKARSHLGNLELLRRHPRLRANEGRSNVLALLHMCRSPRLWPDVAVYLGLRLASRLEAWRQRLGSDAYVWERDETSRTTDAPTGPGPGTTPTSAQRRSARGPSRTSGSPPARTRPRH